MARICWVLDSFKGEFKLQFEVNGQIYFLSFLEDENRWYVFAPTAKGVHRIPVYVDADKHERVGMMEMGKQGTLS